MSFQKQHSYASQGHLFHALKKIRLIPEDATLNSIRYSRCGRTDKGVSAAGQASGLRTPSLSHTWSSGNRGPTEERPLKKINADHLNGFCSSVRMHIAVLFLVAAKLWFPTWFSTSLFCELPLPSFLSSTQVVALLLRSNARAPPAAQQSSATTEQPQQLPASSAAAAAAAQPAQGQSAQPTPPQEASVAAPSTAAGTAAVPSSETSQDGASSSIPSFVLPPPHEELDYAHLINRVRKGTTACLSSHTFAFLPVPDSFHLSASCCQYEHFMSTGACFRSLS